MTMRSIGFLFASLIKRFNNRERKKDGISHGDSTDISWWRVAGIC